MPGATPRPHHELSDATRCVEVPARVLGGEPLVEMIVTVEDNICAVVVEGLVEGLDRRVVAVQSGAEQRVVPVGEGAGRGGGGQVQAQPLLLGRAGAASPYPSAVAVEDHDVPGAQVVA